MLSRTTTSDLIVLSTVILLLIHSIFRGKSIPKGLRLPPGPPGKYLVGNTFDLPSQYGWETYTRWAQEYGNLVYIKALQQGFLVVNSEEIAHDLFDKRSRIYSDRPRFPMLSDLLGFDWATSIMQYCRRWQQHRRLFHQYFHPKVVHGFHDTQVRQTGFLLRNLLDSPSDFVKHLRHCAGATIIKIVYGFEVLPTGDPYIEAAEKSMAIGAMAGIPGTFLVDVLPFLKHVPEWLPGAGFRRNARIWRKEVRDASILPSQDLKKALHNGTAHPSIGTSLLNALFQQGSAFPFAEEVLQDVTASAYFGGADTTVSTLSNFVLAMVLHPEKQRKAQAELDAVIGMGRLPTFEDRIKLPYVNAIIKEIYRWRPVLPLAIAHRVTQDDQYGEYFIPSGTFVIGNSWAMLRNEAVYRAETEEFRPERFLRPGVKDPVPTFGFGRRICPGRHMADDFVFINVASILKVFEVSPASDEYGNQIPVKPTYTSGLLSFPEPFQCAIIPRSKSAETLIRFAESH